MKRPALFPLMLGVSICFHAGLGFFLSVTSSGAPGLPVPKDPERPLALVNIALLEPAIPEPPQAPQPSPRPSEPLPIQDPLPVEHYTTTEEAVDQPRDEPGPQGDGVHAEPAESTGTAEQAVAASRITEETARQSAEYVKRNYNYLQRRIRDKLVYPAPARRAGIQGITEVTFTIHEDGKVSDVTIRKSSGHAVLDDAAIQTIIAAAPFPKPPAPARIAIPISFRLR